jgi:hypothetical protein
MSDVRCFLMEPTGEIVEKGSASWPLYRRVDTGEVMAFRDAPPGAMVQFDWGLTVKLPNGRSWNIDGEASNCDRKGDKSHRCWCRHGTPPNLTVDKTPESGGSTCGAGGGSIQAGDYHGFLRNGVLTIG